MKLLFQYLMVQGLWLFGWIPALCAPDFGFSLPDSITELTIRYKTVRNLILLPVIINDSVTVNLVLDTGCRNLVLFGKRFEKIMHVDKGRKVIFSGLGSGDPIYGSLSLTNKVSIGHVLGEHIPVIVVPSKNIWSQYKDVHGVIGYDILVKFEIELNPKNSTITFRPANKVTPPEGYNVVPMRIVDSRPVIDSNIQLEKDFQKKCDLMIDTGSALGLLMKTTSIEDYSHFVYDKMIGIGLNGPLAGYRAISEKLTIENFHILNLPTGIVESPWHNYASIGMQVLKDYVVVLNYCQSYAAFKTA